MIAFFVWSWCTHVTCHFTFSPSLLWPSIPFLLDMEQPHCPCSTCFLSLGFSFCTCRTDLYLQLWTRERPLFSHRRSAVRESSESSESSSGHTLDQCCAPSATALPCLSPAATLPPPPLPSALRCGLWRPLLFSTSL